jgi:hypothetical protein
MSKARRKKLHDALSVLVDQGLTQADVIAFFHERGRAELVGKGFDPREVVNIAQETHTLADNDLEIDGTPLFNVSDDGVWVQGWFFVRGHQIGKAMPLPEHLAGRVWLVEPSPTGEITGTVVVIDGETVHARLLTSMSDAVDEHGILSPRTAIVLAENEEEAVSIWIDSMTGKTEEPEWICDPLDEDYGFGLTKKADNKT